MVQLDLYPPTTDTDKAALRAHLHLYGWQTRKQLCGALGWTERKVRDVAESMGADVVRGQAGFKLTDAFCRDSHDLPAALQAADAAESQAHRMLAYSVALRRRLHALIC